VSKEDWITISCALTEEILRAKEGGVRDYVS